MNAVTIVLLLLLLLLLIFLFTRISVSFHSKNFDSAFQLRFGFIKINTNRKKVKKEEPEKTEHEVSYEDTKKFLSTLSEYDKLIKKFGKYVLKHVRVDELTLDIRIGSSDAALTAIVYGMFAAIFYPFLALVKSFCKIDRESVELHADFSAQKITYLADIQLSLKVYEMIAIILVIIVQNQKMKKRTA